MIQYPGLTQVLMIRALLSRFYQRLHTSIDNYCPTFGNFRIKSIDCIKSDKDSFGAFQVLKHFLRFQSLKPLSQGFVQCPESHIPSRL